MTQVVSLQWYDGKHGLPQPESPTLVICYDNGRLQMMVNESDESEYGVNCAHLWIAILLIIIIPFGQTPCWWTRP